MVLGIHSLEDPLKYHAYFYNDGKDLKIIFVYPTCLLPAFRPLLLGMWLKFAVMLTLLGKSQYSSSGIPFLLEKNDQLTWTRNIVPARLGSRDAE